MEGKTFLSWIDDTNITNQIHFSSKNDFGMVIENIAKYKCTLTKNGTMDIKMLSMNRK
jgi:hypothetical protein